LKTLTKNKNMPFPNFHTCRVKDPSLFKSGSFRTLHTKTKGLTFISAILKATGKSAVQSYRYDKKVWSRNRASSHCSSHKGKFEGAVDKTKMLLFKKQMIDFDIRNEKVEDLVKDAFCLKMLWNILKVKNVIDDWSKEEVSEYYKKIVEVLKKKKYPRIVKKDLTSSDIPELLKPGGNTAFQGKPAPGLAYKLCMIEEKEKGTSKSLAKKICESFKK
jgi:hypothetical protein